MHYEMSTVMEVYYASYAWKAYEKAYNDTLDIEAAYQAQLVKEFGKDTQNARYDVTLNQSTLALSLLYEAWQKACKAMQGLLANLRSLIKWLGERGLELTEEMPEHGTFSWQRVTGEYRQNYVLSAREFINLRGNPVKVLSNGQYTQAIITDDADGFKTV